jgi:YVTN family beta-propeller protein
MVIATIGVGDNPYPAQVNLRGTRAYVANQNNVGTVSVIDTATNTVISTVTVGSQPKSGALNRAGTTYYVPNFGSGTISVVSLPSVPGKPTRVTASAGVESAKVSWQAPAFPGGEAISGYRVTAFPGKKTCTTTKTSCEITGLTPGVTYTFGVVARNAIGFSRPVISDRVTVLSAGK